MTRRVVLALLLVSVPAFAVITRLVTFKDVLAENQCIATVIVEKLDPAKPSVVLVVKEDLKGKVSFRRLAVLITGDAAARKDNEVPKLLERLAEKQELVLFSNTRGKRTTAFLFTNGTWLQLTGVTGEKPEDARFEFAHLEPYLRRTFKGTTAEMKQVIADGLSGKREPPPPDANSEPGLGPPVKK